MIIDKMILNKPIFIKKDQSMAIYYNKTLGVNILSKIQSNIPSDLFIIFNIDNLFIFKKRVITNEQTIYDSCPSYVVTQENRYNFLYPVKISPYLKIIQEKDRSPFINFGLSEEIITSKDIVKNILNSYNELKDDKSFFEFHKKQIINYLEKKKVLNNELAVISGLYFPPCLVYRKNNLIKEIGLEISNLNDLKKQLEKDRREYFLLRKNLKHIYLQLKNILKEVNFLRS